MDLGEGRGALVQDLREGIWGSGEDEELLEAWLEGVVKWRRQGDRRGYS